MASKADLLARILNRTKTIVVRGNPVHLVSTSEPIKIGVLATTLIGSAMTATFYGLTEYVTAGYEAIVEVLSATTAWVVQVVALIGITASQWVNASWVQATIWLQTAGFGPFSPLLAVAIVLGVFGTVAVAYRRLY